MAAPAALADAIHRWGTGIAWPRGTRDEETWQRAVLAEEMAALGTAEPPTDDELWGRAPDPGSDPPGDAEADVPAQVWITRGEAERAAAVPELFPAGLLRGAGAGTDRGFGDGGVLDTLRPGAVLAGFTADAWAGGLAVLSDDELIGVLRAWRRLTSWAAAGELAAVTELTTRREHRRTGGGSDRGAARGPGEAGDGVPDELACALTLTRRSAENLADRALRLADLPGTAAALALGWIDMPKALTVIDGVAALDPGAARAVEDHVLAKAPRQTTGELRAAVRRAVFATDPTAARRRREVAEKDARVELWDEPAGTKALAGRDLPPADVLAADQRISAIARELKNRGATASLGILRAKVYLALLAGQPLDHLLPAPSDDDQPPTQSTCSTTSPGPASRGAPDCAPHQADPDNIAPDDGGADGIGPDGGAPEASGAPDGGGPRGGASDGRGPHSGAESDCGAPDDSGLDGCAPDASGAPDGGEPDCDGAPGSSAGPDGGAPECGGAPDGGAGPHGGGEGDRPAPAGAAAEPGGMAWQVAPPGLRRVPAPAAAITGPWPPDPARDGLDLGRLTGSVNLTVPLTTLLDLTGLPGEVAGFGPVDAGTARLLARAAAQHPATRWCLTVTDETGRVMGHGCRRRDRASPDHPEPAHREAAHREAAPGPGSTGPGTGSSGSGTTIAPARADDPAIGTWNLVVKLDRLAFPEC
ncbi:MAG TPA: hypothetical protein VKD26_10235, partial [Streptosporangiaceae bacterium]|nr:hypothetical protein [Streptosporangiaceae bacterium]